MPDFEHIFRITVNPLELIARGSAVYWFLWALFRFVLRRDVGSVAIADVLLLVLLADASQNAMAGGYESVTDGIILVSTIAGWNYALDWASYRWPLLRRWLESPPMLLVKDGRMLRPNMRRELISAAELMSSLREQGVEKLEEVKRARMEPNGHITVIKVKTDEDGQNGEPPSAATQT